MTATERAAATVALEQVERARAGDAEAIRLLWERHRRWVAAVLLANKDRSDELEDLLQDTALRMVRGLSSLETTAAFEPWLRQVALNVARAEGRKKTRRRALLRVAADRGGAGREASAEHDGGGRDHDRDVARVLDTLPEAYREALLLRGVRGMSYRQIALVTGLTEAAVETRIARGRRLMRERAAGTVGAEESMEVRRG
ncbi:MAG: sigma-70 family RNA polymerase sigma factor [Planctomycetota bacterium]